MATGTIKNLQPTKSLGDGVSLVGYTDRNNPYVAPCDGYLGVNENGGTQARVRIQAGPGVVNKYVDISSVNNTFNGIYVRKGLSIWIVTAPSTCTFTPIIDA